MHKCFVSVHARPTKWKDCLKMEMLQYFLEMKDFYTEAQFSKVKL